MTVHEEISLYTIDGSIARITLNRPDKRNALNEQLVNDLKNGLSKAEADDYVRAVVITGAGRDFCAGADLAALQRISEASVTENEADARSLMDLFTMIRQLKIPVIAAVQGRALAGGCGLATACDLVLATKSARFGYPEVKIGFVPAMVTAILRRNVSEKLAFELLARGAEIGADEARRLGLVNQVFAEETFESDVAAYVAVFQRLSKSAVTLTKTLLYQIDAMSFVEGLQTGMDVNVIARMTEDCRQGIGRFLKRDQESKGEKQSGPVSSGT